jgi:hypothetical protein
MAKIESAVQVEVTPIRNEVSSKLATSLGKLLKSVVEMPTIHPCL